MASRIDFKEDEVVFWLKETPFCFPYTNGLLRQLIEMNIRLPFNCWVLLITKI